jgi:glutamate:Na+ symporter, ESS family
LVVACLLVAVWLLCGAGIRYRFAIFDRIYVPTPVIAGFIGLAAVQLASAFRLPFSSSLNDAMSILKSWPPTLIAVVFAGMLLPRAMVPWKQNARAAGREAIMVWIVVLGQTAIGLLITWLLIQPFYDVPNSFGMLLETGFAGGHGTATAMGQVFASPQVNLQEGLDLGLLMATVGLIYGTVSGIVWINLAKRMGLVPKQQTEPKSALEQSLVTPTHQDAWQEELGRQAARDARRSQLAKGLDPLLLQAIWLAVAMAVGVAIQSLVMFAFQDDPVSVAELNQGEPDAEFASVELLRKKTSWSGVQASFPLFIYTLLGGWIVRKALKLFRAGDLIEAKAISRWTSMAMDLLVVAAIATVDVSSLVERLVPFCLLVLGGMIWTGVCLLVLSKMILPSSHWFELGLINYGMSTGTTATGFVLLRIVDPELKTDAAQDYALAAPFSAPFIGGGMLTITLPLVLLESVPIAASALMVSLVVVVLVVIGRTLAIHDEHPTESVPDSG